MINASYGFFETHLNHASLNYGLTADILQQIDILFKLLTRAGIPVRPYSPKSVQTLMSLDDTKKQKILNDLQTWNTILMSSEQPLDKVDERHLASKALGYFNFHLKDYNWEDTSSDEIIEIYNPEGIQLYRSLNFFKTCGYSLLDLCVMEWFVLWERPKAVIEKMMVLVQQVMTGVKTDSAINIRPHLIRETYDDGTTQPFYPRAALVEFKNIYPAYDLDQKRIIGFVCTSKGTLISVGDDALKVDFI